MTPFNINPALQLINLNSLFGSRLPLGDNIGISLPQIPQLLLNPFWSGLGNMGSPWYSRSYGGEGFGGFPAGGFKGIGGVPSGEGDQGEKAGPAAPAGGAEHGGAGQRERAMAGELELPKPIERGRKERDEAGRMLAGDVRRPPPGDQRKPANIRHVELPRPLASDDYWEKWFRNPLEVAGLFNVLGITGSAIGSGWLIRKYVAEPVEHTFIRHFGERVVAVSGFFDSWNQLFRTDPVLEKRIFDKINGIDKTGKDAESYKREVIKVVDDYINRPISGPRRAAVERVREAINELPADLVMNITTTRQKQVNNTIKANLIELARLPTSSGRTVLGTDQIIKATLGKIDVDKADWSSIQREVVHTLRAQQKWLNVKDAKDARVLGHLDLLITQIEGLDPKDFAHIFGDDIRRENPVLFTQLQQKVLERAAQPKTFAGQLATGSGWLARHFIHSALDPLTIYFATSEFLRAYYHPEGNFAKALGAATNTIIGFTVGSLPADMIKTVYFGGRNMTAELFRIRAFQAMENRMQSLIVRAGTESAIRYAGRAAAGYAFRTVLGLSGIVDPVHTALFAIGLNIYHLFGDVIKYDPLVTGRYDPKLYSEMLLEVHHELSPPKTWGEAIPVLITFPFYMVNYGCTYVRKGNLKEEAERFHHLLENVPKAHIEALVNLHTGNNALPILFIGLRDAANREKNRFLDEILFTAMGRQIQRNQLIGLAGLALAPNNPIGSAMMLSVAQSDFTEPMRALQNVGVLDLYRNFNAHPSVVGRTGNIVLNVAEQFGRYGILEKTAAELMTANYGRNPQLALLEYAELLRLKQTFYVLGIQAISSASDGSGYRLFKASFGDQLKEVDQRLNELRSMFMQRHGIDLSKPDSVERLADLAVTLVPENHRGEVKEKLNNNLKSVFSELILLDNRLQEINLDKLVYRTDKFKDQAKNFIEHVEEIGKYLTGYNEGGRRIRGLGEIENTDVLKTILDALPKNDKYQKAVVDHINKLHTSLAIDDANIDTYGRVLSTVKRTAVLKELGINAVNRELKNNDVVELLKLGINQERLAAYVFSASNARQAWERLTEISSVFDLLSISQEEYNKSRDIYIEAHNTMVTFAKELQDKQKKGQRITEAEQQKLKDLVSLTEAAAGDLGKKHQLIEHFDYLVSGETNVSHFINEIKRLNIPLAQKYQEIYNSKQEKLAGLTNNQFEEEYDKALLLLYSTRSRLFRSGLPEEGWHVRGDNGENEHLQVLEKLKNVNDKNKEETINDAVHFLLDKYNGIYNIAPDERTELNGNVVLRGRKNNIIASAREQVERLEKVIDSKRYPPQSPFFGFGTLQYRDVPDYRAWHYSINRLLDRNNEYGLHGYIEYLNQLPDDAVVRGGHAIPNLLTARVLSQYAQTISGTGYAFDLRAEAAFATLPPQFKPDYQIGAFREKWKAAGNAMNAVRAALEDVRSLDTATAKRLTGLLGSDIERILYTARSLEEQHRKITYEIEDTANKIESASATRELKKKLKDFDENYGRIVRKDIGEFLTEVISAAHHDKITGTPRQLAETVFRDKEGKQEKTFYEIINEAKAFVEQSRNVKDLETAKKVHDDFYRFLVRINQLQSEDANANKLKRMFSDYLTDELRVLSRRKESMRRQNQWYP
jgi:hypothetical protein